MASLIVGISKTGLAGSGIISVVMFALLLPGRAATGALLPLLIAADLIAVAMFRRQANWHELWRIFPATALGVIIGWALLDRIDDTTVKRLIGAIIVVVVLMQTVQRLRNGNRSLEAPSWFAGVVGATAGFATMIANAAGPIMTIYLLAMRLPKLEFVGTGAWFFLVINVANPAVAPTTPANQRGASSDRFPFLRRCAICISTTTMMIAPIKRLTVVSSIRSSNAQPMITPSAVAGKMRQSSRQLA